MLQYDPNSTNDRKTKQLGWVPGKSYKRPTRRGWDSPRQSAGQSHDLQKARFALIATMWHMVSPGQIAEWQAAVTPYKEKAYPGAKMPSSAFTLYMYVNLSRLMTGSVIVLDPPDPVDIPTLTITDVSLPAATELDFVLSGSGVTPDWVLYIRMSRNISPGVQPTPELLQLLEGNRPIFAGLNAALWEPESFFAENMPDMARGVSFAAYNLVTGQVSEPIIQSATYMH